MERKNKKSKNYAHFDERTSISNVWDYISNAENIKSHGFYPFIHYEKKFNKFTKGAIKEKSRHLCYSSHIDRYIYSYYGYLINQKYNDYVLRNGINDVAVAYRDNLKKNNIHFAKQAFDFIKESKDCYIIIGDFTNFFDSLDHEYLKERLCELYNTTRLPDDLYAVYKNITKYSKWELEDLLKLNNLATKDEDINVLNKKSRVLNIKDFRKFKSKYIVPNRDNYGIPQGSAISAILSNTYMMNCDRVINSLVKKNNGLYMRYSDDFIVVLPRVNEERFKKLFNMVTGELCSVPNLVLQADKTQIYHYENANLLSCNTLVLENVENGRSVINYLGFTFDGKEVTIRDKTITKYYYRLYRKLNTIVKNDGYTPNGRKISCKNVYEKYSIKGSKVRGKDGKNMGNFISYVQRAESIFGDSEPINRKTKRHMLKIRRKIDKAFGK